MNVLLVLEEGIPIGTKVMVKLDSKILKEKVIKLLNNNKAKEAFNLIYSKAEVQSCVPQEQSQK
ncbi:MAG: hypothetical protein ACE5I1_28210 [bacterium]